MTTGSKRPLLVAHRGARAEAPDNTRAAFDRALETPIDGIEMDVQMSRDGVLALYHDQTLYRICGRHKRIPDTTWPDLAGLDAGGWFDPAFSGEPLVTFTDFLNTYAHRTRLLIEIKSRPKEQKSGHVKRLTEKVVAALLKPGYADVIDNFSILSFDPEVLKTVSQLAPNIELVLNLPDRKILLEKALAALQKNRSQREHIRGFCFKLSLLSDAFAAITSKLGKRLLTYSCNTARQLKRARALPLDVLMTDDPRWLTGAYGRKGIKNEKGASFKTFQFGQGQGGRKF